MTTGARSAGVDEDAIDTLGRPFYRRPRWQRWSRSWYPVRGMGSPEPTPTACLTRICPPVPRRSRGLTRTRVPASRSSGMLASVVLTLAMAAIWPSIAAAQSGVQPDVLPAAPRAAPDPAPQAAPAPPSSPPVSRSSPSLPQYTPSPSRSSTPVYRPSSPETVTPAAPATPRRAVSSRPSRPASRPAPARTRPFALHRTASKSTTRAGTRRPHHEARKSHASEPSPSIRRFASFDLVRRVIAVPSGTVSGGSGQGLIAGGDGQALLLAALGLLALAAASGSLVRLLAGALPRRPMS